MTGTALITGGASGIGRLHALRLAARGVPVAILDLNREALDAVAGEHENIRPFACDVTDEAVLAETVARIEAEMGEIGCLIVCAAIMPGGDLLSGPPSRINKAMQVNYGGMVNTVNEVVGRMLARGRGDVIIYGSTAGIVPIDRFGAYGATKAAVNHYAKVLISENRNKGLRFQLVCPPAVDTPLLSQQAADGPGLLKEGKNSLSQMITPEEVVTSVERALEAGREIHYPGRGKLIELAYRAFPKLIQRVSNGG